MTEILFLAHRIPYPPDRGDKIRSFNFLRELTRHARVHLACLADDERDAAQIGPLREALGGNLGEAFVGMRPAGRLEAVKALFGGRSISVALFASHALQDFVDDLLEHRPIDTIFAFSSQMAQFVPDPAGRRFVMDFVDVDSAKFAEYSKKGRGPKAWVYAREGRKLLAFEQDVAARSDLSLFVSESEAAFFRNVAPGAAHVVAIGNGVDHRYFDPKADFSPLRADQRGHGSLILFTGQMDYPPNVDAVVFFAKYVMPLIQTHAPEARFAIVGREPVRAVRKLQGVNGTEVVGAVKDIRSWLAAADVVVAPLKIARGVQNKVLEAMAMAKPVVATSAAFEGIEADPNRDLLVADGAGEQAAAVLALLTDPVRASCRGGAARRCIEARYSWSTRLAPLTTLLGLSHPEAA